MDDRITRLNAALEGRYAVQKEIGQGGMAVVFLAEDIKHNRRVALKVLRSELVAILGGDRFLQEIEVTANLQHPNILPLYDSGEAGGFHYYVMPLMEDETLRERLDREHQLPVEEAIEIAKDVAAAVDYAHRHGIIHRDIKPSNILLHDGRALVADFGIALAMTNTGGNTRLTETGLSLGTPHYMSPEQAAGDRELGARSDLYSLGAVVYEMLVGEPPHVAKTAQAVVAKILTETPASIRNTRELTPPNVEAAVAKALARSPADRFGSVAEFAAALSNPAFSLPTMAMAAGPGGETGSSIWRRLGPIMTGAAAVATLVAVWGWVQPEEPKPVSRYNLAFMPGQELVDLDAATFDVARGGRAIVYVGPGGSQGTQLWVRWRDRVEATPLPGTEGARAPSISPAGTEVVFVSRGQLKKAPLQGGAAITVADSVGPGPVAWVDDETLVYWTGGTYRLRVVPASGGTPRDPWPEQPPELGAGSPAPIPGRNAVLFGLCDPKCTPTMETWVVELGSGKATRLLTGAFGAVYLETGHLVFARIDGAVFAVPFDADALEVTGTAVPLMEGVRFGDISLTPDGTLLMMTGPFLDPFAEAGPSQEVVWVTRDGVVHPVDPTWRMTNARSPGWALSPDGTRLAIALSGQEGDDIWIKELDDGPLLRLTYDPAEDARPRWSDGGASVHFLSRRREGVSEPYVQRADGAGDPAPVLRLDTSAWDTDLTPDGSWLVARTGGTDRQRGGRDIMAYHLEGDSTEVPLLASDYDEVSPKLSPDGRWLTFASQESGEWEIYVRPFPNVHEGRWVVSGGGGRSPMWAHSGREIFYVTPDGVMMSASVESGEGTFRVTGRTPLFNLPEGITMVVNSTAYDVSLDDQRFIMVRTLPSAEEVEPAPLILVENWSEEGKERMASQHR